MPFNNRQLSFQMLLVINYPEQPVFHPYPSGTTPMNAKKNSNPDQSLELKELEEKLDQLIEQYNSVKNENTSLKTKQEALVKEKAKLLEKTTLARLRVEAMINRLKAMEHG